MRRFISAVIGIGLICAVIFLGYKSYYESGLYVLFFGLAAALIAPMGISALGFAIKKSKDDKALSDLRKISQIDDLIKQADSYQQEVTELQNVTKELRKYVQWEAKRYAAYERKAVLLQDAERILQDIKKVDRELELLGPEEIIPEMATDAVLELQEQLKNQQPETESSVSLLETMVDVVANAVTSPMFMLSEMVVLALQNFMNAVEKGIRNIFDLFKK